MEKLLKKFNELLQYSSEKERRVRYFNLGGKMQKEVRMKFHHRVELGKANCGPLLEAMDQRLDYVLSRSVPVKYDQDSGKVFETLQEELKSFKEFVDNMNDEYQHVIGKARKTVNMDKVKLQRKEKLKMISSIKFKESFMEFLQYSKRDISLPNQEVWKNY